MEKMATLLIPDFIYNWIVEFFNHQSHVTRFNGKTSDPSCYDKRNGYTGVCNRSSSFYSKCRRYAALHKDNRLFKYADDTYLVVPANLAATSEEALSNMSNSGRHSIT